MCLFAALAAAAPSIFGATASAAMATTMTAAGYAGSAMSAYGVYQQASMQKKVASANAKVADYQAHDAIRRGDEEANKIHRQTMGLQSAQRAGFAGHGVDVNSGTAANIQDQTDFFGQWDANTARGNAAKEAYALKSQAANYRAEASSINPLMSAGGSLLTNSSSVAGTWYKKGP